MDDGEFNRRASATRWSSEALSSEESWPVPWTAGVSAVEVLGTKPPTVDSSSFSFSFLVTRMTHQLSKCRTVIRLFGPHKRLDHHHFVPANRPFGACRTAHQFAFLIPFLRFRRRTAPEFWPRNSSVAIKRTSCFFFCLKTINRTSSVMLHTRGLVPRGAVDLSS